MDCPSVQQTAVVVRFTISYFHLAALPNSHSPCSSFTSFHLSVHLCPAKNKHTPGHLCAGRWGSNEERPTAVSCCSSTRDAPHALFPSAYGLGVWSWWHSSFGCSDSCSINLYCFLEEWRTMNVKDLPPVSAFLGNKLVSSVFFSKSF